MPMKSFRWLMFVAPLLIASLASAAPLPAPDASVVLPAAITGLSACPAKAANAQLPVLNPAAQQASTLNCGSCSVPICRGAGYNSICQGGTQVKHCIAAYGNNCTDGTWQCQCWSGPLP
jgi:hypothetical protein